MTNTLEVLVTGQVVALIMKGLGLFLLLSCRTAVSGGKDSVVLGPKEDARLNQTFRMTFSLPIESFYKKSLTINETGRCELVLETNKEHPEKPEIGVYAAQLGAEEAGKLFDRVMELEDILPTAESPMPPGLTMFEVVVETEGNRYVRSFDPHTPPKRYRAVSRQLKEIEAKALDHMEAGLRADFSFDVKQVEREKPLHITLRFSGVGTKSIRFYNPLLPPPNGFGRITLSGVRSDVKDEDMQFFHRQAHQMDRNELIREKPAELANEAIMKLKPGESAYLTFNAVLDWPPGSYHVKVMTDQKGPTVDEEPLVTGRITTPPQLLIVTGATRKGDEGVNQYDPPVLR